ncbi:hypothetical protein BJY27_000092 [Streptomyces rapamycinicus]|uniref:Uncharacterized protein n=2 Tax=Streptomyces rapamycinicus TaxID=1226757 RepID=A0A3L8R8T2_STRRN|nr:hypothetical protein [Streptomyces rapamycinicus]RLV76199.1 hypothetical protein D3C57_143275 [Streptomyces rapamycinicus NRRL 5491]
MHVQGAVPMRHNPEPLRQPVIRTMLRSIADRFAKRNVDHDPAHRNESALSDVLSMTRG